jgi:ABC-type transport system involved in cytochrome bd biosynthesis fused ATPase/permease subunit
MPFISLKNITTPYCPKNVNLDIEAGELMAVLGFTGAARARAQRDCRFDDNKGEVYFKQKNMNPILQKSVMSDISFRHLSGSYYQYG